MSYYYYKIGLVIKTSSIWMYGNNDASYGLLRCSSSALWIGTLVEAAFGLLNIFLQISLDAIMTGLGAWEKKSGL
ncbi:hypothetical protein C1646_822924 [Rhizophagus diaphanus]|nr:hypothetical protein C1646_822924 [Rhizophagus diaphanus] [Rhizophagus sp. MUCL 43196]